MTEAASLPPLPRTVVLATDLSARCDRATDRAAWLAQRWSATLVAVHALEPLAGSDASGARTSAGWRDSEDALLVAEEQMRRDLADTGVAIQVLVRSGVPPSVVAEVAQARSAGLVVTGLARDETLGRFGIGATVDALLRKLDVPVLVVKSRARGPYRRIALATDFSAASQRAFACARGWFPMPALALFHVHPTTFAAMAVDPPAVLAEYRRAAEEEGRAFLERAGVATADGERFPLVTAQGHVGVALHRYAKDASLDLIVTGSEGRGTWMRLLQGSRAAEILAAAPCDVLIVPDRQGTSPG